VGAIYATGSIGTFAAVYLYHKKLKRVSFRWILLWVQVLWAVFGMLDLILVTRFNQILHIPDYVFVIGDEGMTQALSRLKWMPLLILAAKLCPPGIEGTFFSFLMSVDNVAELTSSWLGAGLLTITKVTRDNFEYLWLAVTIRNILRLVPLFMVFLLPNTDPEEDILEPPQPEQNIQLVVTTISEKESGLGIQSLS
jgi:BT1 family